MIAGCGEGVIEGLATPFIHDLHLKEEPGRYINFTHSFWSVGVLVTVLVSGALLSVGISWRYLIGGVSVLGLISACLILFPAKKGHEFPENTEPIHWTQTRNNATKIITIPKFWLFFLAMFFAGGGEFCLTFWCASYIQLSFGASAWAGGVGTACFAGGMVLGRMGCGILIKQHHFRRLLMVSSLAGAFVSLSLPFVQNLWLFFVLLFLVGVASAPYWPSIQSYCSDKMPEVDSTMLLILLSCAGVPGCGFFTWLMGVIGNATGDLRIAFYLVPICYFSLATLIIYEWWLEKICLRLSSTKQ
jgi:fucose permease